MPFYTDEELEQLYKNDTTFQDRIVKLFALRELYKTAVRKPTYAPSGELVDALEFTQDGKSLIERAMKRFECSEQRAKFCVFLLLFHHSCFIDVERTKIQLILDSLSRDIENGALSYPWLFDHMLYDKAFNTLPQRPGELSAQQTEALLSNTPTGVYQINMFVAGPLGVLQSEERRWFLPVLELPLYHCVDPMCGEIHVGELTQLDKESLGIVNALRTELDDEAGPSSEWRSYIRGLVTQGYWYDDFSLVNIVWLLGQGFSDRELRQIVEALLVEHKNTIREKISPPFESMFKASAANISQKLSKAQLLQVALIASNRSIAAVIDNLIDEQKIKIPSTEVRRLVDAAPLDSWTGAYPECSDLGIRILGVGKSSNPLARLKRLICQVYNSSESRAQLRWLLRQIPGSTMGQQIEALIAMETPSRLLRDMIVSNIHILQSALTQLKAEHLVLPQNEVVEKRFVNKLLWKLGFNKTEFDSPLELFWNRVKQFKEVVSSPKEDDIGWIASVRSAGVNLFVALEELLDRALSFACWIFLVDPLKDTHTYSSKSGRALMATELSGLIETDKGPITYDINGKNTMFPLILGFKALLKRIDQILATRESFAKPTIYFAHYHEESSLQLFPYKHNAYVCDASEADVKLIRSICDGINVKLQESRVFEIRNKLEHNNEELPSAKDMLKGTELLCEVVSDIQDFGLIPVIFAMKDRHIDSFGRERIVSRDGMGRELTWQPSAALQAIKSLPAKDEPQIIVQGLNIPETNEPLRFVIEEDSDYVDMWKEYPKYGTSEHAEKADGSEVMRIELAVPEPLNLPTEVVAMDTNNNS